MYVYNVRVKGYSVGLTFDKAEAEAWYAKASGTAREKELIRVPYRKPQQ